MFTSSPRYSTLTQQVARTLEEQIRQGTLRDSLPGERTLATTLQVGRRTVRAALALLRQKKLIRTAHGAETKILNAPAVRQARRPLRTIGLVLPQARNELRPYATVFIDSLRALLYENGFRLDTHIGRRFFSRHPATTLERLVTRFPSEGWLLAFSNHASQAWFYRQRIPTTVIGSAYEDIKLPFVDIDMLATARHAAQVLLRKGHRRIALIIEESVWVGDRKTEQGFIEGIRQSGLGAEGQVYKHGGNIAGLRRTLSRLLQMPARPTALFVVSPYYYLTVAALLAEKGLQVPRDISLLCRDDDFCLRHLPVTPSRYIYDTDARAKEIFSNLMWAMQANPNDKLNPKTVLMIPEFFEGDSIARIETTQPSPGTMT